MSEHTDKEIQAIRATELTKGCIVMMKSGSGLHGYGNAQCVSSVCEPLGELSLYGHNQYYKTYHVDRVVEYPLVAMRDNK